MRESPRIARGRESAADERTSPVVEVLAQERREIERMAVLHDGVRSRNQADADPPALRAEVAVFAGCEGKADVEAADRVEGRAGQREIVRREERSALSEEVIDHVHDELMARLGAEVRGETVQHATTEDGIGCAREGRRELREPMRAREAIVVREREIVEPRSSGSGVARTGRPGVLLCDEPDVEATAKRRERIGDALRVRGAIVDDDHLPRVARVVLSGQRVQALAEPGGAGAGRNDYGDRRSGHERRSRSRARGSPLDVDARMETSNESVA